MGEIPTPPTKLTVAQYAKLPTLGVYDIFENKVVIEAQYEDVFIRKDGLFEVRTFDAEEMIIDLNGEVVEM